MKQNIYILVTTEGDTICAYTDKEKATTEALEIGVDVEMITLYS